MALTVNLTKVEASDMGELRRLYYQTKEKGSFKTFKWVLKGRWNQGSGNSGNTRTYQQWDELGISYVGSNGVKYGPTYWTVDSFSSSGTPWADMRGPADLFDGEWGSETSKCDYSGINDTDGYVEIIIHTTSGEAIIPNGVGLISANYQSNYQSSTPGHFILYGLDERTNEYVQLIDVPAANVNKGNVQTTTVSFDPVEVVTGTYYLLAPSEIGQGIGLRTIVPKRLTIDLNNQGTECTTEFLTQTKYPGVWTGYKVFRLGGADIAQNTHYYNYIKNLSNLSSNFTMYYFFAMYYNNTGRAWGKATYSVDSSNCVAQTSGWTPGGQDSQKPQYDKSRYRSVTVNVSKGGNINWDFYYNNDPWYGNSIYYAIPQELVQDVINSK